MRLTHLKLAGFKSFVDPITIQLSGQRVGVVGPNGCGKSNVMESVRWVLGESSAKEMRGDSMDAVIFNGSSLRKPISRASVELIFDNSLGKAAGEWSQYAEISVKRIIERDRGSTYYINNSAVRRRDVADLFLGTGLGGRAYAIIGQNTISRIVEAKPDELRVFLEEAAGISKYKERRRETELRLRDTRENLTRVEDISRELVKQINRLASQAAITQQYHRLQAAFKRTVALAWLLKKRDAALNWEKTKRMTEKLVTALEAQMATLRSAENQLETLRLSQYSAAEAMQTAQAAYYETNATVSNLEQQVRYNTEAQERLNNQKNHLFTQVSKLENATQIYATQLQQVEADLKQNSALEKQSVEDLQHLNTRLPHALSTQKMAHASWQEAIDALNKAEQDIKLIQTSVEFLNRELNTKQSQITQLNIESSKLVMVSETELSQEQQALVALQAIVKDAEQHIVVLTEQERSQTNHLQVLRQNQTQAERLLNQNEAQTNSLTKIQTALITDGKINDWLKQYQLQDASVLWQKITVNTGWERAVEAVLGQRLNALLLDNLTENVSRPTVMTVLAKNTVTHNVATDYDIHDHKNNDLPNLLHVIKSDLAVLKEWLAHVYTADNLMLAITQAHKLKNGEFFVTPDGDMVTANSVTYYAAQSSLHGVLERQRELDALRGAEPLLKSQLLNSETELLQAEFALKQLREQLAKLQQTLRNDNQQYNQANIIYQRLQQQAQFVASRQVAISVELEKIELQKTHVLDELQAKQLVLQQTNSLLVTLKINVTNAQKLKETANEDLRQVQLALQQANSLTQENTYKNKLLINQMNELSDKIKVSTEEKNNLQRQIAENETALTTAKMGHLKQNLEAALTAKQNAETALAQARNQMADADLALQLQERSRMQFEQQLHVERDKLEVARLNDQEARLIFEQCQQAFNQTNQAESDLLTEVTDSSKTSEFEQKSQRLQDEIAALGAVNLAANEELAIETERKTYLDAQVADLSEATATLEDAIRKIDHETKAKLKHTFDETNRHFGLLFSTLFNGGVARLELLGEEILDTGMQVVAQPPGKKNSTIHLLSGGEKALTAIALVFALFKLNPAPFCLMDEVDAPLDDSNTERFCKMVRQMSEQTQFMFVSHNKITMEMAQQLIGVTMQESGVSRVVDVDMDAAAQLVLEI